jgi:hypothetical protein
MSRVHTDTQTPPRLHSLPSLRIDRPRTAASEPWAWPPVAVALASIALPGLGHLMAGSRRLGWALLAVSAIIVAAIVAYSPRDPVSAFAWVVQPRNLLALLVVDIALLVFRLGAMLDAYLLARRMRPVAAHRGWPIALTLLIALTAAPHIAIGYYDLKTYSFLGSVFDEGASREAVPPPAEVQLSREVRLADGVTPQAPPVVVESNE